MFSGIIEEVGTIVDVAPLTQGRALRVRARQVLQDLEIGDSIAIDGTCHTVVALEPHRFTVHSVATTLERTIVGEYGPGRRVNLERALALGDRLGGHLVQGHVDGVGQVLSVDLRGEHVLIDFTLPEAVAEVTLLHGSIAVNGISLTINALPAPSVAQVSIVPHTWAVTAVSDLTPGSRVNLEGDMLGKYVRHLLGRGPRPDGVDVLPQHTGSARG